MDTNMMMYNLMDTLRGVATHELKEARAAEADMEGLKATPDFDAEAFDKYARKVVDLEGLVNYLNYMIRAQYDGSGS